jgi:hypothetical protein
VSVEDRSWAGYADERSNLEAVYRGLPLRPGGGASIARAEFLSVIPKVPQRHWKSLGECFDDGIIWQLGFVVGTCSEYAARWQGQAGGKRR